jgi:hypothetical protein
MAIKSMLTPLFPFQNRHQQGIIDDAHYLPQKQINNNR